MKKEDIKITLLACSSAFFLVTMLGVICNGVEYKDLISAKQKARLYAEGLVNLEELYSLREKEYIKQIALLLEEKDKAEELTNHFREELKADVCVPAEKIRYEKIIQAQQDEIKLLEQIILRMPENQIRQNWRVR